VRQDGRRKSFHIESGRQDAVLYGSQDGRRYSPEAALNTYRQAGALSHSGRKFTLKRAVDLNRRKQRKRRQNDLSQTAPD
jgi:hypothetical protein